MAIPLKDPPESLLLDINQKLDIILAALQQSKNQPPPPKPKDVYLTTNDLMKRWDCGYETANAFMHRPGSGAIKPSKKLLVSLKEVEQHERMRTVRTG